MICEYCNKEHDGSYGSGRFCSKECRGAFCAKMKSNSNRRKEPWVCSYCNEEFESRKKLFEHKHKFHPIEPGSSWNKGLTKFSDKRVEKCCNSLRESFANGKCRVWCEGKSLTEETRNKISIAMKIAHKEGRAHNIGESRWNNEPSYPERWFMKVIENEFNDKNYVREYPFFGFSLDFAWIDKKRCIEIDGEQHQRFDSYKERDERKNKKLISEGWKFLRLVWKDVFFDPKKYILEAKEFIES